MNTDDELAIEVFENEGGSVASANGEETQFHFKIENSLFPNVYLTLINHMLTEDWEPREMLDGLYAWARIFIMEFDLKIPMPPITIDGINARAFGHFMPGHNCWGLEGEIKLNRKHLDREPWRVLGTLFHELLHAWQEKHGRPSKSNYHNKEFRDKAASYGLLIDERGVTNYAPSLPPDEQGVIGYNPVSPFRAVLERHGVQMPAYPSPLTKEPKGQSTLLLWVCECKPSQKARIGRGEFFAICPRCNSEFRRLDWPA